MFFLPNRHRLFDPVNAGTGCGECLVAVPSRDANRHADRSHWKVPDAVDKGDLENSEFPLQLLANFPQLSFGHLRVHIVIQPSGRASFKFIPHRSQKQHLGSSPRLTLALQNLPRVNRLVRYLIKIH